MVLYKLSGGPSKHTCLLILILALLLLAACTHDASLTGPFKTGDDWIRALNQEGVRCRPFGLEHPPPPPRLIEDVRNCHLDNGDTVTIWIVDDAKQMFDSRLAGSYGPRYIFYRANWLAFVPNTAPAKAVSTIRQSFKATG